MSWIGLLPSVCRPTDFCKNIHLSEEEEAQAPDDSTIVLHQVCAMIYLPSELNTAIIFHCESCPVIMTELNMKARSGLLSFLLTGGDVYKIFSIFCLTNINQQQYFHLLQIIYI